MPSSWRSSEFEIKKNGAASGEAESRRLKLQPKGRTQTSTNRKRHFELIRLDLSVRTGCTLARPPRGGARGAGYPHIDSFEGKLTVGAADQQGSSGAACRHQHPDNHRSHPTFQHAASKLDSRDEANRVPGGQSQ
jgi:hypothetical protein